MCKSPDMRVACIQLCSGSDQAGNLARAEHWLAEAKRQGAELAILPENFALMGVSDMQRRAAAEPQESSGVLLFLAGQAARHGMAIIGGSVLLQGEEKLRNACAVYDARGRLLAVYDKIHLFDVDVGGDLYRESAIVQPGDRPATVQLGAFRAGLSICYDLRFPELYRHYALHGCDIISVVAAFTEATGRAHWRPLLRARAIENQCYLLASAQVGVHADRRRTWGHSMVIDPWGDVIAELAEGEGVITASLSVDRLQAVRRSLPALQHRRLPGSAAGQ